MLNITRGSNDKEKPKSKAEQALERIADQIAGDRRVHTIEPAFPTQEQEQEIPTPGAILDMVIGQLISELNNVSEELSFVLYCGEKHGWISEDVREEYKIWRESQKVESDDKQQDNTAIASSTSERNTKRKTSSSRKPPRSIMVSGDGSIQYSHPEDAGVDGDGS